MSQRTISKLEMARGLAGFARDLPWVLRSAPDLKPQTPGGKRSIALRFEKTVARHGDRPFLRFHGISTTYRQANAKANQIARALEVRGVGRGSVVALLAHNCPEYVLMALASLKLGATVALLNFNQVGDSLDHSVALVDVDLLIYQEELASVLATGNDATRAVPSVRVDELLQDCAEYPQHNLTATGEVRSDSTAFFVFTSGTTGLPKASKMSHHRWLAALAGLGGLGIRLRRNDVLYVALPFYHNNAISVGLGSCVLAGSCLAIGERFSASRFWDEIAENRATAFCYIGELCRYLLAQPPRPDDANNTVRVAAGNGLRPEIWQEFTERFGIGRVAEFYAASEAPVGFVNFLGLPGSVGCSPMEYVIAQFDENSGEPLRDSDGRVRAVATGTPGLLLSRIDDRVPYDGYTDPAQSEKKIVRGVRVADDRWFNSGDIVREQGFRHIEFVDRSGDTFRWKGENVATSEVERALFGCPGVAESVVYGVAVPGADGKAGMAAIRLAEGASFDAAQVAQGLRRSLPGYAIPAFVRIVHQIETTSTFKNVRTVLRQQGFDEVDGDALWVLVGDAYVPFYASYPQELATGSVDRATT